MPAPQDSAAATRRTGSTVAITGEAPAPRRREAAFARFTENGHTCVVRQDASGALTRGEAVRALTRGAPP
ncbi:hypothetical protein [Streptomyces sp. NPDC046870]|uniref:hypothetical protein n=1 Tax=Streptomyces sp. NPDC046870 TaxID=3155135 RepID=UPI003456E6D9